MMKVRSFSTFDRERDMMKIKYLIDTDTALLEFTDHPIQETREMNENIYLDLDARAILSA